MLREYMAPSFPLPRGAFRRALQVGHGRARMHIEAFGAEGFRSDILEVATVCKVYDPQVEGLPAAWLADLCASAGVVEEFLEQPPAGKHWDWELRCAILKELAIRGIDGAREALYEACQPDEYGELHGAVELVELDGSEGLVEVARRLGALARERPSRRVDDTITWSFDQEHGEGQAIEVLQAAAKGDPAIRSFLESVAMCTEARSVGDKRRSAHEVVASVMSARTSMYWLTHWGRHATTAELEGLLQVALSEAEPIVLENALRCLSGSRSLPLRQDLLPLLEHDDPNVRLFCARTLAHHRHSVVRSAGLAALAKDVPLALELLRKNTQPEDTGALRAALCPVDEPHLQHDLVFDVVHLLENNPGVRDLELALYVYEESPCQNCRGASVKLMLAWEECPGWVLEEGRHDASEEVRDLCVRSGSGAAT